MDNEKQDIIDSICQLPVTFHKAGILGEPAMRAIVDYARTMTIKHSVETG